MAKPCYETHPLAYQKLISPDGRYYIQKIDCWQGDSVVWWAPDRCGYTFRLDQAGVYEEDEARRIERLRGEELAIPCSIANVAATRHVTGQDLAKTVRKVTHPGGDSDA